MTESEPITVAAVSLGCPKNTVDIERMLAILAEGGCVVGAPLEDADVALINTCGFIEDAREEAMEVIREAVALKKQGRPRRVVVAGCLPQREGQELRKHVPEIDAVVGVNDRDRILEAVRGEGPPEQLSSYVPGSSPAEDRGRLRVTPRHTSYLRIAEGCSRECSFCTIPAIRGPFRSKPMETVLAEAQDLAADGVVDLNVIAQDTTSWGSDLPGKPHLGQLLRELNTVEGIEWIRLMYTYPMRFSEELIDALAECEHVVPYVDMPLQHISESVLKRMGRGVSRATIEKLLNRLRERIPRIAIRTTFIVGFPGETEEDFRELVDFVHDFHFDAAGVFAYSPESATPAAEMDDQVPLEVKAARREALMLVQQQVAFNANREKVDAMTEVLVDGVNEDDVCVGRHPGQAPEIDGLCLLTEPRPVGRIVSARVVDWDGYDLVVEPTNG